MSAPSCDNLAKRQPPAFFICDEAFFGLACLPKKSLRDGNDVTEQKDIRRKQDQIDDEPVRREDEADFFIGFFEKRGVVDPQS